MLDDSNMPQIAALRKNCQESLSINIDGSSSNVCGADIMNYITAVSGDVFLKD